MHMCDVILAGAAVLFIAAAIIFIATYKIGKEETRHRPCGGGRHNA